MNLLKCPFCGKVPEEDDEDVCYPNGIGWYDHPTVGGIAYCDKKHVPPEQWCYSVNCVVHHGGCGAEMHGDSKQEAMEKWNRRV